MTNASRPDPHGVTATLAAFISEARWTDLPPAVIEKTQTHVLDTLGCESIGTLLPWINQVRAYAEYAGRDGPSTVVGGQGLVAEWAAFANATAAHGFELDDYHSGALAHPSCVVVPAAFAVGEAIGASGKEILLACALGMEAIIRIGLAVAPSMVVERGFHETCTQGVFGAAIAAAKLLGHNAAQIESALGIAGSHASGTRQYSHSGGEVKRLHAGLGAGGGVRSAMLAAKGVQGPPAILEGARGFLQAFANHHDALAVTQKLGDEWQLLDLGIKPHASCGLIHAPTDALAAILSNENIRIDDIDSVEVGVDRLSMEHVGSLPLLPADMNGAQFNLPYSLGMLMAGNGTSFSSYRRLQQHGFALDAVLAAGGKVRMHIDPAIDALFPQTLASRVRVIMRDGRQFDHVATPEGSKDHPVGRDVVRAKFLDLLGETQWGHQALPTADAVEALQDAASAAAIMTRFRANSD